MDASLCIRVDKWLWATRFFKTRTMATDACKSGKVKINNEPAKSSKEVKQYDIISINFGIITKIVKVKEIIEKRVSAKIAVSCFEELTPKEDYEKLKIYLAAKALQRPRGLGRPTKKERRDLDKWEWTE